MRKCILCVLAVTVVTVVLTMFGCTPSSEAVEKTYSDAGYTVEIGDLSEISLPANAALRQLLSNAEGEVRYAFYAQKTDVLGVSSFAAGICFVSEDLAKKAESDWLAFLGEDAFATVSVKGNLAVIGTADAVRLIDDYKDGLLG